MIIFFEKEENDGWSDKIHSEDECNVIWDEGIEKQQFGLAVNDKWREINFIKKR